MEKAISFLKKHRFIQETDGANYLELTDKGVEVAMDLDKHAQHISLQTMLGVVALFVGLPAIFTFLLITSKHDADLLQRTFFTLLAIIALGLIIRHKRQK